MLNRRSTSFAMSSRIGMNYDGPVRGRTSGCRAGAATLSRGFFGRPVARDGETICDTKKDIEPKHPHVSWIALRLESASEGLKASRWPGS